MTRELKIALSEGDAALSEGGIDNFHFCSLDDPSTLGLIERIGEDHVMLEMDYPHSDTTWPDTQEALRSSFERNSMLNDDQIRKLTHQNAARLFRHPLPQSQDWPR